MRTGLETSAALDAIALGNRDAFTGLYSRLQPTLVRYAAALLAGDIDAALDVVDDAFFSIWRDAGRFSGAGSADGWVRRVVRNKAVDWLRRRKERPAGPEAERRAASVADPAAGPEEVAGLQAAGRRLRTAMAFLTPIHREVVWLCYFEELSVAEIAQMAGCPENTVKTRLFHARKHLRAQLEGFDA